MILCFNGWKHMQAKSTYNQRPAEESWTGIRPQPSPVFSPDSQDEGMFPTNEFSLPSSTHSFSGKTWALEYSSRSSDSPRISDVKLFNLHRTDKKTPQGQRVMGLGSVWPHQAQPLQLPAERRHKHLGWLTGVTLSVLGTWSVGSSSLQEAAVVLARKFPLLTWYLTWYFDSLVWNLLSPSLKPERTTCLLFCIWHLLVFISTGQWTITIENQFIFLLPASWKVDPGEASHPHLPFMTEYFPPSHHSYPLALHSHRNVWQLTTKAAFELPHDISDTL